MSNAPVVQPTLEWTDAIGLTHTLVFDNVLKEEWDEGATVTEHPVENGPDIADHVRVSLPKCTLTIRSTNEPIQMSSTRGATADTAVSAPLALSIVSTLFPPNPAQTIVYQEWYNPITLRALAQAAAGLAGQAAGGGVGNVVGAVGGSVLAALLLQAHAQTDIQQNTLGLPNVLYPPITATTQQWPAGTDYVNEMHSQLVTLKNSAQLFILNGSEQTETNLVIETLTFSRSSDTGTGEDITIGLKQINVVTTQTVALPIPSLPAGGGTPPTPQGAQMPTPAPASVSVAVVKGLANYFSPGLFP